MKCPKCNSKKTIVKFGHTRYGRQRYFCTRCRCLCKDDETLKAKNKKAILQNSAHDLMKEWHISYRTIMKLYGISKSTVYYWYNHWGSVEITDEDDERAMVKFLLSRADMSSIWHSQIQAIKDYLENKEPPKKK